MSPDKLVSMACVHKATQRLLSQDRHAHTRGRTALRTNAFNFSPPSMVYLMIAACMRGCQNFIRWSVTAATVFSSPWLAKNLPIRLGYANQQRLLQLEP